MQRIGIALTLTILMLGTTMHASAAPEFSLGSALIQRGGTASLNINLSNVVEPCGGINAKLFFPDGITATGVSKGAQLPTGFTIDWRSFSGNDGNGVSIIAYSDSETINASSGVLLVINLLADNGAPLGSHAVVFATTNPYALVNSKHAISNEDGSESMGHTTLNGTITISEMIVDSDGDGLPDDLENTSCTNPQDADTDDDGIQDGTEDANRNGVWEPELNETDPCNIDTDGDGIQDGTEQGYVAAMITLDTNLSVFKADEDPATKTDPLDADTDDDGIPDGLEDTDQDGKVDGGETDPNDTDSDDDLIQDGTELGYTLSNVGPDTDLSIFQPDEDDTTTTDPLNDDTDGDGTKDGEEDANQNGRLDKGETDPNKVNDVKESGSFFTIKAGEGKSAVIYLE